MVVGEVVSEVFKLGGECGFRDGVGLFGGV